MTDAFGPANAANSVTAEPADTRVFGANDTWFQDCSPGQQNGTAYGASFFNFMLAMLRGAVRGMNIPVNNANTSMLLQAIQATRAPYAADTGTTPGQLVVDVNQPGFQLIVGVTRIWVMPAFTIPGPSTIATRLTLNNSAGPTTSFGNIVISRQDGTGGLNAYDMVAGGIYELIYDGREFQLTRPAIPGVTGDVKWAAAGTSQSGYVPLNGLTIGPVGSGATALAAAQAQGLFTFIYDNFSRALCPLNGSDLGSDVLNWAGGRTIALPDWQCKAVVGVDAMGGAASTGRLTGVPVTAGAAATPGSTLGEALHTLSTGELPTHTPSGTIGGSQAFGAVDNAAGGNVYTTGGQGQVETITVEGSNFTFTGNPIGSNGAHNNTSLVITGIPFIRL
jgi:hypothetical protein